MAYPLALLTILSLVPFADSAETNSAMIGQRVITHHRALLKVGDRVVDDANLSKNLAISGNHRITLRVYRVEHVQGDWLWLKAEKRDAEGWIKKKYVIPYSRAIDYFTRQVRWNPEEALWYLRRGAIWFEKQEYDIAILDYNEAIWLDPTNEAAWQDRGLAWSCKDEYDKAIGDYDEAIRIDPRYAVALNTTLSAEL